MEFRISFHKSRKLIIVIILLLSFISVPAYATLWGNKVDAQDLQRIITKLRIYDDPDLPYYNEIFSLYYSGYTGSEELLDALNKKIEITQQAMKILDTDKKKELGNLTYGRYILNAINEKKLVEMGLKTGSPDQANGEYFSKLGENLADWKSQLSKLLLTKIIVATCTAMGAPALSIGISTLGLFCDLSIIKTSITRLNEVWYEKAFWSYIKFRNEPFNYGHTDAWTQLPESYINHIFLLLPPEKWKETRKAIEEHFKSLWNRYGDHIAENELDADFKSQQRESLKMLLLYALGSEPHPIIASPLKIAPPSPYQVGDIINAEFTITNQGTLPIKFSVLTVGGRDPDNHVSDFTFRQNITLETSKSYNYQGTLTLNKVGDHHFFCTYQTPDGDWNTNVDLGSGLVDEDRIEDINVEEKEKPSIAPDISEELNIEWERSFKITDYQAQVKILENGDIQVSEIFEYDFDGDFNGIIRTIGIKGSDGFKYFKASEYFPEDKELEYTQSLSADMMTYKIYDKSRNERKLFLLEYQLENVATLYNDTAEFYWKFFDESNTSPIGHIKIEIELPSAEVELSPEELKVFGHGPLDGKVSIREDGKIVYEVFGLSSGEMVEVRILFPTRMIPNSSKIINQNKFVEIMEEESGSIEALEEEIAAMESVEDKTKKEITFKTFYYKDNYAEYSARYPDWPNIPEAKFTHVGLKKSLDVGYSKEISIHMIISQDFDLMDLFKFLREVPEDLEKEAIKRGKTIEFYMGSTQIIKDEKTDNGNFMEILLDLDGEFLKKVYINDFLNSSKIHILFKDFYCEENNKYFSVSVIVAEDKWSKYQNIAKSIINSMKVIKTKKEKLLIDSSLYHIECNKPIVSGNIFVVIPVNVSGPADELALILANPEGETDIRFILKRALIDNFETVKLRMGNAPLSEGPYILTVKTVTPEKIIYKKELWFTLPDVSIADAEFTYKITHLGGAYGYAGYYFLEMTSLTLR